MIGVYSGEMPHNSFIRRRVKDNRTLERVLEHKGCTTESIVILGCDVNIRSL